MPRRNPQRIVAIGTLPNRDPHNLLRFVRAQNTPAGPDFTSLYDTALDEILNQSKTEACKWVDCVLPRLQRPGKKRERMALRSEAEAHAFMELPVLGNRVLEILEAMVLSDAGCPVGLLGSRVNAAKAYNSMALFAGINEKVAELQRRLLSGLFKGFNADDDGEMEENHDKEDSAPPQDDDLSDTRVSPDSLKRKRKPEGGDDGKVCKKNKPNPAERPEGDGNDGKACKACNCKTQT